MDAHVHTPPPSPPRRRPKTRRSPTPVRRDHTPSPELIFSMSPTESGTHFTPPPKTTLNPGALLARARQQSSNAFKATLNNRTAPHGHRPLLYSFPKTSALQRAHQQQTTTCTDRDIRPRFSPIAESDDGALQRSQNAATPIAVPLPIPMPDHHHSFDSAQYSPDSFYDDDDDDDDDGGDENHPEHRHHHHHHARKTTSGPLKIVGFDTGTDDSDSGDSQEQAGPFRFERFISHKALSLDERSDVRPAPLQTRNRR